MTKLVSRVCCTRNDGMERLDLVAQQWDRYHFRIRMP
jgi:hypothetical protein